ncbi:MAG: hypothetical protein BYD32DRAFT_457540 [Podila humilis]|nr:MAG: hypothetical protein BYD32DRAFT_457540 [Podila humilis]
MRFSTPNPLLPTKSSLTTTNTNNITKFSTMKFQTILLVAAALMITYVQAAPVNIIEQPDVDPNEQKAKCGYDMIICW